MTITTDTDLTNLIADLAQKQLLIHAAKVKVQTTVEAAKLAYDEATRDLVAEIESGFSAISTYCAAHRDRLFPERKGKRQKTYQVLQHKLQYRAASEVTAPPDIIARIGLRLQDLAMRARSIVIPADLDAIETEIETLNSLLRQPPAELNKDAAAAALADSDRAAVLNSLGVYTSETETFKVVFTLTPES